MQQRNAKTPWSRIDGIVDAGCSWALVIGGALVALTVVLQVVLRYVFKFPLFGLEEFSRLIAVWVYFIGAVLGTRLDSHVQGDVAQRFFPTDFSRSVLKTVTWTLSFAACLVFLYFAGKYSIWLYHTGERTTGLWWPRITSVGSMFFGAFFMTMYSMANVIRSAAAVSRSRRAETLESKAAVKVRTGGAL